MNTNFLRANSCNSCLSLYCFSCIFVSKALSYLQYSKQLQLMKIFSSSKINFVLLRSIKHKQLKIFCFLYHLKV